MQKDSKLYHRFKCASVFLVDDLTLSFLLVKFYTFQNFQRVHNVHNLESQQIFLAKSSQQILSQQKTLMSFEAANSLWYYWAYVLFNYFSNPAKSNLNICLNVYSIYLGKC